MAPPSLSPNFYSPFSADILGIIISNSFIQIIFSFLARASYLLRPLYIRFGNDENIRKLKIRIKYSSSISIPTAKWRIHAVTFGGLLAFREQKNTHISTYKSNQTIRKNWFYFQFICILAGIFFVQMAPCIFEWHIRVRQTVKSGKPGNREFFISNILVTNWWRQSKAH
jgi:hypothetical protein